MPRIATMKPVLRRPGRVLPWVVTQAKSISPTGKRRDKWFATKEKANTWIREETARLRSYSDKARGLTDEQKAEASEAFTVCEELGFKLMEAVREKAASVRAALASAPVSVMVDEAVTQLIKEGKSSRHVTTARYVGKKFKAAFPSLLASQLTTRKIQDWLDDLASVLAPETLKQYRRYVSLFCEHGRIRGGYLQASPTRDIKLSYQRNGKHGEIAILTPDEVRRLLDAAKPELRPYIALCAFAGLRPSEAQRLDWSGVSSISIYVSAKNAKTRSHRIVTVSEQMLIWIRGPLMLGDGKVFYSRRAFRKAIEDAKLLPWKEDCLRHSFGSYWLALHHDENKLAQEMGNSPAVIVTNYRRPVTVKAAKEYFSITP